MRDLFLRAARGERTERPPVWLMRQAGRYLPEYRQIRASYSFREAIEDPDIATKISLQPWERFRPDGIVMYSDILTVLGPLGLEYHLESGIGPVIDTPITAPEDVDITPNPIDDELAFVGELLERLSDLLAGDAAVIGFIGGPFTLACYLAEGRPSRSFMGIRRFRAAYPTAFIQLLDVITDVLVEFASYQVDHGADVIQLFDTYAGLLSPADFREFLLPLHQRIFDAIDEVPTILFARNVGSHLGDLKASGADVIGLDWTMDIDVARAELGSTPVQGNLDPAVLFGSQEDVREQTMSIIERAGPAGHILNLGHGVDKGTPVASVETFVETAKSIDR